VVRVGTSTCGTSAPTSRRLDRNLTLPRVPSAAPSGKMLAPTTIPAAPSSGPDDPQARRIALASEEGSPPYHSLFPSRQKAAAERAELYDPTARGSIRGTVDFSLPFDRGVVLGNHCGVERTSEHAHPRRRMTKRFG
jgi:hypothetical protein